MSSRDLINLGISPDSGTGDSARRGGEKINTLFADIYANFGDNPIGNNPDGENYGYKINFEEYEFKVGELHPAGKYNIVTFNPTGTSFDANYGYGVDSNGAFVISDITSSVPDIYKDSEWYFLSRGEAISPDLSSISVNGNVHFILPLASVGDTIVLRDLFKTWGDKTLNFWTTPYEFRNATQVTEWETATGKTYPDSDSISISGLCVPYKRVNSFDSATYPKLDQSFNHSSGQSLVRKTDYENYELIFTYRGPRIGWEITEKALDTTDVQAAINAFGFDLDSETNRIQQLLTRVSATEDLVDSEYVLETIERLVDSDYVTQYVAVQINNLVDSDFVATTVRDLYSDIDSDVASLIVKFNDADSDLKVRILDGGTF